MKNKWLLRFGTSILALALVTGCSMNNDDVDPVDDAPANEEDNNRDMMEGENGGR